VVVLDLTVVNLKRKEPFCHQKWPLASETGGTYLPRYFYSKKYAFIYSSDCPSIFTVRAF